MSERKCQKTTQINEENRILNTTTITKFEHLPNELILTCFTYFDFYRLYEIFFGLNQHLNELILNQAKIYINLCSIPHGKFLTFCFKLNQLTTIGKNYPLSIQTWDEDKFNLILNDDFTKDKFSKLKSLSISNIKVSTLTDILFDETTKLYETLERLSLENEISGEDYEIEDIPENDDTKTTTKLSFNTLIENLLPYLPKLKNLIINSIYFNEHNYQQQYQVCEKYLQTF
ncbi:unnamed protein product [Rotaria sp. Silwood2]|nr:unnamed protein product [Rotaria sp. Silwood2]